MLSELYRLGTLPVAWVLAAGWVGLSVWHFGLGTYAAVALAVVLGGRDVPATVLCAVPSRSRLFASRVLAVLVLGGLCTFTVRGVLLCLFGLGLAGLTRGLVWPAAVLAGVPILLTPVLRAAAPGVVPLLPQEASTPVLAGWTAAALLAGWATLTRRDA
ncbi:hypothetical protein [Dactylosporangium matsuzakiense]|uniref:Uncharacterized protein n=1 Tax=Dactylosporangium matsuzakiense TaxID=53360 RepID=A0A9W6NLS4_9ACTN|nr:hypothetical protein [Dactylosporangium matsuzakiense]UWZ48246.1 hypothetical protein Dmats_18665 [Dactylosporangium matsuzakiense]GLL01481.1 hypothetical protein GCM10017581_032220 [Dactylosporangium matsuzakiense]